MKCPKCGKEMSNMMHFESGKDYAYHSCKHCRKMTHRKRIHYEEFEREKSSNLIN